MAGKNHWQFLTPPRALRTISQSLGPVVGLWEQLATVVACIGLGETNSYQQPGHLRKLYVPNTIGDGHSQNGDQ